MKVSHRRAKEYLGISTTALYRLSDDGYLTRAEDGTYDTEDLRSLITLRTDVPSADELTEAIQLYRDGSSMRFCALTLAITADHFRSFLTTLGEPIR